jgi:hypothetical protein
LTGTLFLATGYFLSQEGDREKVAAGAVFGHRGKEVVSYTEIFFT